MPPNKLIAESSPYLLQHAYNPVDWHAWNEETLQKARSQDKMLLISIGYSACHWCHVMERESFEDQEVAQIMNRHFICIKVDREERPDVDQVYMNAVQLINGNGGWPLNCFALPDGRPFFGGTYFRKEQWMNLLENIAGLWQTRRQDIEAQAESITQGIRDENILGSENMEPEPSPEALQASVDKLKRQLDYEYGGTKGAPKFPMPVLPGFLQDYVYYEKDEHIRDFLNITLQRMAFGGIFDQVGGGFARYSVDPHWHVPHFEKMLYDNAQLVSLYSRAYRAFGEPFYREVAEETLEFVRREMTSPEGGFYCALDADSEGEEGKFYTWTETEIRQVLQEDAELFCQYYQVGGDAIWEDDRNILVRKSTVEEFARQQGLKLDETESRLRSSRQKLLEARDKRPRPGLDNKILTSWNALMAKGYADAFLAFGRQEYLDAAIRNAKFILQNASHPNGGLYHNISRKSNQINGFMEDYAAVINLLITLYQADFHEGWLRKALDLTEYAIHNFYEEEDNLFYFTSLQDSNLIARKTEIYDNVIPSSNSMMARALHHLALAFDRDDLFAISNNILNKIISTFSTQHSTLNTQHSTLIIPLASFSNWSSLWLQKMHDDHVIAVCGPDYRQKIDDLRKIYRPNLLFFASEGPSGLAYLQNRFVEGKTMIYFCSGKECRMPVEDPVEIFPYFS